MQSVLVVYQNSIVCNSLHHKGQLGSVAAKLAVNLQTCFHSQLVNLVNSFTQPQIFKSKFCFQFFFPLPSAYHNLLWETLYDLKSPLIFVETQNQRLISQCAVCLSSGSRPVVSKGSRNTHYWGHLTSSLLHLC